MCSRFFRAAVLLLLPALAACRQTTPVQVLDGEMAKVRDYVPARAVMAHRGSTYWTPEETESAWRWAREMGADYLESDLQCTKDGVILANHDENLARTTNIEEVFGADIPACRVNLYLALGFTRKDAEAQVERDKETFRPFYAASYYYAELLTLDAGKWFNAARPGQARARYAAGYDGSRDRESLAYANGQGLMETIQYAGFREACDDIRYASYLLDLAERAAASDDVDVRLLGRKARLYLATLPGETMDLDAVRLEIVEKILALRAALGDDPAPAVAATKEGGTK